MQRVGQNRACHALPAAIVPLQSPCYEPRGIRGFLFCAQSGSEQSLPCSSCCCQRLSLVPRVGQNRALCAVPAAVRGSLSRAQSGSEQPSMLFLLLSGALSLVPRVGQNKAFHALPAAIRGFLSCAQSGSKQSLPCSACCYWNFYPLCPGWIRTERSMLFLQAGMLPF